MSARLSADCLALLAGVQEPAYALDGEGRVLFANAEAAELFGASPVALLGARLWEAIPALVHSDYRRQLEAVGRAGRAATVDGFAAVLGGRFSARVVPLASALAVIHADNPRNDDSVPPLGELFDAVPLPCAVWQRQGGAWLLSDTNAASHAVYGEATASWIGLSAGEIFPRLPELSGWLDEALASGRSLRRLISGTRAKSLGRTLHLTLSPAGLDFVLGFYEDVTEQVATARSLAESESRYRALFDQSPNGVLVFDTALRVVEANLYLAHLLGRTREELVGVDLSDAADQRPLQALRRALEGEVGHYDGPLQPRFLDRPRVCSIRCAPLRGRHGEVVGGILCLEDVTALHEAEQEQRRLAAHVRLLLDATHDGFYGVDAAGRITFLNAACTRMLGYEAAEVVGLASHELFHARHADGTLHPREACPVYACLQDGSHARVAEDVFWRKDGSAVPVTFAVSPIREGARIAGAVVTFVDVSEQKRARDALRRSEERFALAVRGATDGLWELDIPARRIDYSPRFRELLGLDPAAPLDAPDSFRALIHPDDERLLRDAYRAHVRARTPLDLELRLRCGDGSWRWFWLRAQAEWDAGGRARRMAGSISDVTARHKAEEAVRRAEGLFRGAFDQSITGIYVLTRQGPVYTNPRMAEMWRMGMDELMATPTLDLVAEDDRARVGELIRSCFDEGRDTSYCAKGVRRDGSTLQAEVYGSTLTLDGETYVVGTILDVSERWRAQEALRESEERYRRLVELAPMPIVVHVDGRIAYANPAAAEALGFASAADLVGHTSSDLVCEASRSSVAERFRLLLDEGMPYLRQELHYRRLDGGTVVLDVASIALSYEGRRAVLSLASDITRKRALEAELRQSQKMEAVGRLAGGIAHDFNNLLAVICSGAEFALADLPEDSPVRADVEDVHRAAARAAALTRQLLAFSRRQPLQARVLDLNAVVREAEKLLRRVIPETITFCLRLAPDALSICADPGQLEQVLMNLTANARDAMPAGGTLVLESARVQVARDDCGGPDALPAGPYARLSVRDSGHGMDEAMRARIFEPFFTTKDVGKGTGLGLSTVYGIVRQSNGCIRVESAPGQGTSFVIHLPLSDAPCAQERPPPRPTPRPAGAVRVLLVEDEPSVRASVRRMLVSHGHRVQEAANGEEALRVVEEAAERIDLVLSDLVMPEMGGRELAARLADSAPGLKVLFMSGYAGEPGGSSAPPASMALLSKPFSWLELEARIAEILGQA